MMKLGWTRSRLLPSQFLDWCKNPKLNIIMTRQENYQHIHKLNQIKLKPGLGAFYAIQPGNTLGVYLTAPSAHIGLIKLGNTTWCTTC